MHKRVSPGLKLVPDKWNLALAGTNLALAGTDSLSFSSKTKIEKYDKIVTGKYPLR